MHIIKPGQKYLDEEQLIADLEAFIDQPEPVEIPPCPGCQNHMADLCSAECPEAPKALSIEPERYPVEPKVVPLVFELMSSRMMMTCWSCEGHMGNDGKLWKLPMVSFYSMSSAYPKILLKHLESLNARKLLKYRWHVVLSDFSQTVGVTYSIQPDLSFVDDVHLGQLQQDITIIGRDTVQELKTIARKMLDELSKATPLKTQL